MRMRRPKMGLTVRPAVKSSCVCSEKTIDVYRNGEVVDQRPAPPVHDCDYVAARNALIPHAVWRASLETAASPAKWEDVFCRAMDTLARERISYPR